ncbi:uncharacterized protein LOC134778722 [Penaeus indicus]|uniref:uncharacterized protein LOC134778722 n=1 Tax=Penaeus indicus TaxID=29960 RepID=UPI00300CD746
MDNSFGDEGCPTPTPTTPMVTIPVNYSCTATHDGNGTLFYVCEDSMSYLSARPYCQAKGGDLASPDSLAFLRDYLKTNNKGCPTPTPTTPMVTIPVNYSCTATHDGNGTLFYVCEDSMSYLSARPYCQAKGGDLASPDSLAFLRDYLKTNNKVGGYWVGVYNNSWLSGRPVQAYEWGNGGRSGNLGEDCARLMDTNDFFLVDAYCTSDFNVACGLKV